MGAASVLQHLSASLLLACALLSGVWIRRGLSQPPGPGGIPLRIMFFTSNGGELFNSSGAVPAVDLALKDIAASPGVLGRYSLSYTTVFDSRVSTSVCTCLISTCVCLLLSQLVADNHSSLAIVG